MEKGAIVIDLMTMDQKGRFRLQQVWKFDGVLVELETGEFRSPEQILVLPSTDHWPFHDISQPACWFVGI